MGVRTLYGQGPHPYSWNGSPAPGCIITVSDTNIGKGKGHPRTGHEGPEEDYRYSSTLFLTSELHGVGGQRYDPADLTLGKRPGTQRLGGPQGRSGRMRKISSPRLDSIAGPSSP